MRNKKILYTCITIAVVFIASLGMYVNYSRIGNVVEKKNDEYSRIELEDTLHERISLFSIALASKLDKEDSLKDSLLKYIEVNDEDREIKKGIKRTFETDVKESLQNLEDDPNLQYFAINHQTKETLTNSKTDISNLMESKDLQKNYQVYMRITYDKDGALKVESKSGTDWQLIMNDWTKNYETTEVRRNYYSEEVKLKNPKDVSIIYAFPQKIVSTQLYEYYDYYSDSTYRAYTLLYLSIAIVFVSLFMLFSPIRFVKTLTPYKQLIKVKLEILCMAILGIVVSLSFLIPFLLQVTYEGELLKILAYIGMKDIVWFIKPLINILAIAAYLYTIMLFLFLLKYILHNGIVKSFKEHTCIGWLCTNLKKVAKRVVNFDLHDETNRSVLKIVGVNFIIISILSFLFVFGFFAAIVYSIFLFFLLRTRLREIQKDYMVLLDATKKLSKGDFNVEIDENLGLFNSLGQEFENIKEGFEVAVKEEVKSQRMKTELISNVSHDLKTPLTSIITYVDLLKKDGLSEAERIEFVATLDRNSQRLKNLIEDLFDVTKANTGDIHLDIVDVDIIALLKQVEFECLDGIKEKELDFKMNFSNDKVVYPLDASKTYRIFENLTVNVCRYAMRNTRVYVDVVEDDTSIYISMKNISENEINFEPEEVVERFVQGDKSRSGVGSGLGLAIAKSFTQLQGGTFEVEVDGDLFKVLITFSK